MLPNKTVSAKPTINDVKATTFSDLKSIYQYDYKEFIHAIKELIPESNLLNGEAQTSLALPSAILDQTSNFYGFTKPEAIRAFSGLLSLKDVFQGGEKAYDHFVDCQKKSQTKFADPEKATLTLSSFNTMHEFLTSRFTENEDFLGLTWSVLCNDLLKTTSLKNLYFAKGNKPASEDIMLGRLLQQLDSKEKNESLKGFMKLSPSLQEMLIEGYLSACDPSESEQGGYPMCAWEGLKNLKHAKSLILYVMHSIFDVAGAAAHFKLPTEKFSIGSATMHENTWQFFKKFIELVETFHGAKPKTVAEVYNAYLDFRGNYVGILNNSPENTALIRIVCMARIATKSKADVLKKVWQELSPELKKILIDELNYTGNDNKIRAIFVPWCVDIFANPEAAILKKHVQAAESKATVVTQDQIQSSIKEGLRIGLINMAKIYKATRPLIDSNNVLAKPYVAFCPTIATMLSIAPSDTIAFVADGKATPDDNGIPRRSALKAVELNLEKLNQPVSLSGNSVFSPASTGMIAKKEQPKDGVVLANKL